MSNVVTPSRDSELTDPVQHPARWRRFVPLLFAGAMALALWAFDGGQRTAPPPTTGMIAAPISDPATTVGSVTTINTRDTTEVVIERPATYGLTAIGPRDFEPSRLVPVRITGPAEQLVVDTAETLWWRAAWGLGHFDPATSSEPTFYTAEDDLFFASVASISPAVESGVWVAGRDGTLRRFDGQTFVEVIETPETLCQVAESVRLGVWGVGCGWGESASHVSRYQSDLSERGGWLYHWNGRTWEPEPDGRPQQGVAELTIDSEGKVWVANRAVGKAVNSDGLSVFDGDAWTTFTDEEGLPSGVVQRIAGAPPGQLWVRTYRGPSMFDGAGWRSPSGDPELDHEQWRGLMSIVEHGGELVATRVFSTWKLIHVAGGELSETALGIRGASNLAQAGDGLWVAGDNQLYRIDGVELSSIAPTAPDLPSDLPVDPPFWQITALSEDEALILSNGRPWRCMLETGCESWPGEFSLIDVIVDFEGRVLGLSHEALMQLEEGSWTQLTPASAWEELRGP